MIIEVEIVPAIWEKRTVAVAFELPEDASQFKLGHPEWIDSAVLVNLQAADATSHFSHFTNGDAMLQRWLRYRLTI